MLNEFVNAQARALVKNEARSHLCLLFCKIVYIVMRSLFIRYSLIQQRLSEKKIIQGFVIPGPARNCGFHVFHWNLANMVTLNMKDPEGKQIL